MHQVFRGSATSLLITNQTWFLWSTFLNSWSTWSQLCLLPLVQAFSEGVNSKNLSHMVIAGDSAPLATAGTFLSGMFFQFLNREWDRNLPICPCSKGLLLGSQKSSSKLLHSWWVLPWCQCSVAVCSSCAGCFVLEGSHSELVTRGSSPEILKSPSHQVCCSLLQEETYLHPSSSVILWAAHGFSPKHRIFSILLSPIPPTSTEPKTNWGVMCSEMLSAAPSPEHHQWCGLCVEPQEQSCVCVLCLELLSSSAWALCACGWGWGCVFVCLRLGA